jgi:hypothetical protein
VRKEKSGKKPEEKMNMRVPLLFLSLQLFHPYPVRVDRKQPRRQQVERERDGARGDLGGCRRRERKRFFSVFVSTEKKRLQGKKTMVRNLSLFVFSLFEFTHRRGISTRKRVQQR